MTVLNISDSGLISLTNPQGNQFQLQMNPVSISTPTPPASSTGPPVVHTYQLLDRFYLLDNEERVTGGEFYAWGPGWAWQPVTPTNLAAGSGTFTVLNDIMVDWNFAFDPVAGATLSMDATVISPTGCTGVAFEMDPLIAWTNATPETSVTGNVVEQGNWARRYWIVGNGNSTSFVAQPGKYSGTVNWKQYGNADAPLFISPIANTRTFSLAELSGVDLRPYLPSGNVFGWGYNMSAYALTAPSTKNTGAFNTIAELCDLLPRIGANSLRLVHHDAPWGWPISNSGAAQNYASWCNQWGGTLWIDMMHYLGGNAYKGNVWFNTTDWNAFLAQRQQVISLVGANGPKVIGVCEINENDIEYHNAGMIESTYSVPAAQIDATAIAKYSQVLGLGLPANWNPQFHIPTQGCWGSMPSPTDELAATGNVGLDQHTYYGQPGIIRAVQGYDYFIGKGVKAGIPGAMTEWNDSNGSSTLYDDSFLAPIYVALSCVKLGINAAYAFAWSQNLAQNVAANSYAWNLNDWPNFVLAMMPASLIFGRREVGSTRDNGTLAVNTSLSYGQVGLFVPDPRIIPGSGFTEGVIMKQILSENKFMVTVLSRCLPPNQLEKVTATIDGVVYHEGITLGP